MLSIPSELIDEFSRGNGCVFVGAGISMGAGLPSWAELVNPLADEIENCPSGISFLDIAQYYENQEGRRRLVEYLREALGQYEVRLPTEIHKALVRLPIQRIFTTNLDGLLEKAFAELKVPYSKIVNTEDISFADSSKMQLVKVHGDLEQPKSIVITAGDYEDYISDHPAIANLLRVDLQARTVLFLGYGFSDIDLRMILSQVSKESRDLKRNLFTIQINPLPSIAKDLERRGMRVIPLQEGAGPEETTEVLRAWLEEFSQRLRDNTAPVSLTGRATNNLPPRVGYLLGRKADFARVLEGLRSRYPLITIEGFAGIGKTSLAIEVGHACLSNYSDDDSNAVIFDYVVWISAKDKPEQRRWMEDVLNILAKTTNFDAYAQRPLDEKKVQLDRILRLYKILLIIDNFETIEDSELVTWLEQIPEPSKVIVTTRQTQLQQKAWAVTLRGLEPTEALALVRQYAAQVGLEFMKEVSDKTLLSLSEVTGGNPQAMKLTLGLVSGGRASLWDVINELHGSNPGQRIDRLFEELFSRSWSQLPQHAREILLATPLFVGVSSIRKDALQAVTGLPPYDFDHALESCVGSYLLEVDHGRRREVNRDHSRFVIHPMTRTFARSQLNALPDWEIEGRRRCSEYFLDLVRKSVIRAKPEPRYWNALVSDGMGALDPEWPSIQEAMKWADQEGQDDLLVEFVMLLVHYLDSRFRNVERLSYVEKAVAALRRMNRKEDEALLRIDALGWTYVEEDRLQDAYDQIRDGFHIAEEFAVEERNDLLALGFAWRARVRAEQNEFGRALKLIPQALVIDCSPWIKFRVNMAAGDIALKQGNSADALTYYECANAEVSKYGGEGRGYQIYPRIGLAYLGVGRLDEAEQKFRELRSFEQIAIGKLYADYGLAMVAYKRGEIQSARSLIGEIKTQLSRRTTSNLLLKLIKSQEAQLPGLTQELEDFEPPQLGSTRFSSSTPSVPK